MPTEDTKDQDQDQQQPSNVSMNANQAVGGMKMDQSLRELKPGELTYALNAQISNFDGHSVDYQNEVANISWFKFPAGYVVIGQHLIAEQDRAVFWLVNPTTSGSEIGVGGTLTYQYNTLVNQTCLNHNINFPIRKAEHKITACGTEVYWPDPINGRRYMDIDNLPYATSAQSTGTAPCEVVTLTTIDCNKLAVQPNFSIPNIVFDSIVGGGIAPEGMYQFAVQYTNYQGDPYTAYYSHTNGVPLLDTSKIGPDFDYQSGKSIRLKVNNIDTTGIYEYFNLAVIKTISGIVSVDLVGTYQIVGSEQTVVYTGQSKDGIALTINDVFQKYAFFDIAEDITTVQDVLLWKGLTTNERISYQEIANQITPQWQQWIVPKSMQGAQNPLTTAGITGYMGDEIYPLDMVILLKNGYQSDRFPIPGRVATDADLASVQNGDSDTVAGPCDSPGAVPRWQVYNTASLTGFSPEYLANGQNNDCYVGPYQYGEFGYWESTETYPCNAAVWGKLQGEPIRHHKFPDGSVAYHHDADGNIFPLGIRIDSKQIYTLIENSSLTDIQKAQIAEIKIVRGDRTGGNRSVIGKGLFYNVGAYTKDNSSYFYPNYPFNDTRTDPFIKGRVDLNIGTIITSSYDSNITIGSTGTTLYDATIPGGTLTSIGDEIIVLYTGEINGVSPSGNPRVLLVDINGNQVFNTGPLPYGAGNTWNINLTITLTTSTTISIAGKISVFGVNSHVGTSTVNLTIDPTIDFDINLQGESVSAGVDGDITTESELIQYEPAADNLVSNNPYLEGFGTPESQKRFTFHSPDTSFYQPALGTQMKLEGVEWGTALSHYVQVKGHAKYKFPSLGSGLAALAVGVVIGFASGTYGVSDNIFNGTAAMTAFGVFSDLVYKLIPRRNFAYQFNSVGTYMNSMAIPNDTGNKIRQLDIATYLTDGLQGTGDVFPINNWRRESSVFLRTTTEVPYQDSYAGVPSDTSRYTLSEVGCDTGFYNNPISAYYGSIKENIPDQYGQIYSYSAVDTGFQLAIDLTKPYDTTQPQYYSVFGGDTTISQFALKKKLAFFLDNRVNFPDDSDVFYNEQGNISNPSYWFSTDVTQGSGGSFNIGSLFGVKINSFDCKDGSFFYNSGKFYLFAYGIPYFFVESAVNVDYRQASNYKEGDFFPRVSSNIPDDWLQEINVPIAHDNAYNYNRSFSKQNEENVFTTLPSNFIPGQECIMSYPNKSIWSDKQEDPVYYKKNSWIIYRPTNYFDFPLNYGKLVDIQGIENREVLARFENRLVSYNTMLTLNTSNPQQFYLGQDLFRSGIPIDFSDTDSGRFGTQHHFFIKTDKGHVAVDAKRGQIVLIPAINPSFNRRQMEDLASPKYGMSQFFCEQLEFKILKQFPNYPIDNAWNGIGLTGVYDTKYGRLILTKVDYECTDPAVICNYTTLVFSKNGTTVTLGDPNYFCSKSFTISFDFNIMAWDSFHTYQQNWYLPGPSYFFSGVNDIAQSTAWQHNRTYTAFNNFNGQIAPYVIEYPFAYKYQDEILQNVKDYTKVLQYFSDTDLQNFIEVDNVYFNKAILYNNQQNSGVLELVQKPKNNIQQYQSYPKYTATSKVITWTKSNNFYNYNTFWDVYSNKQSPAFVRNCSTLSVDKMIVNSNMDYSSRSFKKAPLMAKDLRIRHILDNTSGYKLVSQFIIAPSQQSYK